MTNSSNPFDSIFQELAEIKTLIANQPTAGHGTTIPDAKLLLNRKEAMEFLSVGETTLWRLTRDGVLTAYKIGKRVMYKRPEILAALETMAA